jgi:hypothetical protein
MTCPHNPSPWSGVYPLAYSYVSKLPLVPGLLSVRSTEPYTLGTPNSIVIALAPHLNSYRSYFNHDHLLPTIVFQPRSYFKHDRISTQSNFNHNRISTTPLATDISTLWLSVENAYSYDWTPLYSQYISSSRISLYSRFYLVYSPALLWPWLDLCVT